MATANKTFVVSWTASTEATSYTLQQTEFGSRNAVKALYSGSGTSTGVTLSGVVGDDFQYAVQACNANGCSAWANASDSTYLQNASGTSAVPASGSSQ